MRIWHRGHIGLEHKAFLETNSLEHKPWPPDSRESGIRNYMFVIDERNAAWPELKVRLQGAHTYISTEFSEKEIAEADWAMAHARHSIGSFVPEEKWWSDLYYSDRCKSCGSGWRQIAPFRIKKEPRLGKNVFADFGSAFELFCAPLVSKAFEKNRITGMKPSL
jgi:hypothetical protein